MPSLKAIFNATDKVLDFISLTIHGGMLVNGLSNTFTCVKPLQDFGLQQRNLLLQQSFMKQGIGQQAVAFISERNFNNLKFNPGESIFTPEGCAKAGLLGLAELYLTGTHLTLAYPIAKLLDGDNNINNSSEFLTAFGCLAVLDIAHWATSGEESAPEHH